MYTLYEKYPHARLLISTSGPRITESMEKWLHQASQDIPTIGLQFSVHESTNEARDKLVPFKAKMGLGEMADFGVRWWAAVNDGRKPFFNYCAHDTNNTDLDANRLSSMYDPYFFNATVSVICERSDGMPATNDHQRNLAIDFAEKLVNRGFDTRVFDPAGQDTIGGGCGQLWFVQDWMKENPDKARPSAGFGKEQVHVPAAQ
jgi:23S rRNA (adenine2503-C2)-methyltransferase